MPEHEHGTTPMPGDHGLPDGAAPPETPESMSDMDAAEAGAKALSSALKGSFRMLTVAMIALAVFYVGKGIFYVHPQEVRFKLRFGEVVPSMGEIALRPGTVHIKWPWEEVYIVSTEEKVLPVDDAFWTYYPEGARNKKTSLRVQEDGFLITGDANIVHMQLRARYRRRGDAEGAMSCLFGVKDPEQILRRLLMASAVKVVGSMGVMDVLKRQGLFERILGELKVRVAEFEKQAGVPLGIEVIAVEATESETKNPTEPLAVRDAFTLAQNASSQRQQLMDEGRLAAISLREDARALSEETTASAQGEKAHMLQNAQADAEAMTRLLVAYRSSPGEAAILREDFFQRTLDSVIGAARGVFVLYQNPDRELRLLLSMEPPPPTESPAQKGD